jgi:hypothetical protein
MNNEFIGEVVIANCLQTLSARVIRLENLSYNRYSIFFNQSIVDVGPSHMLIRKCVVNDEFRWTCEQKSSMQDADLAISVGEEIDRLLDVSH